MAIAVCYYEVMRQNLYVVKMLVKAHSVLSYSHDDQIGYMHKTNVQQITLAM
jgi:hypothetical protein